MFTSLEITSTEYVDPSASPDKLWADLATKQSPEGRVQIVPPSAEVAEYTARVEEQLAQNILPRRSLGAAGILGYAIHPEVNSYQDALDYQANFDNRNQPKHSTPEGAAKYLAHMAVESLSARWEHSRQQGVVRRMANLAISTRIGLGKIRHALSLKTHFPPEQYQEASIYDFLEPA